MRITKVHDNLGGPSSYFINLIIFSLCDLQPKLKMGNRGEPHKVSHLPTDHLL